MSVAPSVFISYPHTDFLIAGLLCSRLKEAKIDFYWDPHMHAGKDFEDQLREQINLSTAVLALWTDGAFSRDWIKQEAEIAFEQDKLIPLLYRMPKDQIPKTYAKLHHIELHEWNSDFDSPCFEEILRQIAVVTKRTEAKRKPAPLRIRLKRKDGKVLSRTVPLETGRTLQDDRCPKLVLVQPGGYWLGTTPAEAQSDRDSARSEGPPRFVSMADPFAIARYPVTFEEWDWAYSQKNGPRYRPPDKWGRGKMPVTGINWFDAQEYLDFLCDYTESNYRLLSEAEWEYVCRGGTRGPFAFAKMDLSVTRFDARAVCAHSIQDAKYNPNRGPMHVFSCKPNEFNVCGMHGNVWEWTADHWDSDYRSKYVDGRPWHKPRATASYSRVVRGGCYKSLPQHIRSAHRRWMHPKHRHQSVGFRVARDLVT